MAQQINKNINNGGGKNKNKKTIKTTQNTKQKKTKTTKTTTKRNVKRGGAGNQLAQHRAKILESLPIEELKKIISNITHDIKKIESDLMSTVGSQYGIRERTPPGISVRKLPNIDEVQKTIEKLEADKRNVKEILESKKARCSSTVDNKKCSKLYGNGKCKSIGRICGCILSVRAVVKESGMSFKSILKPEKGICHQDCCPKKQRGGAPENSQPRNRSVQLSPQELQQFKKLQQKVQQQVQQQQRQRRQRRQHCKKSVHEKPCKQDCEYRKSRLGRFGGKCQCLIGHTLGIGQYEDCKDATCCVKTEMNRSNKVVKASFKLFSGGGPVSEDQQKIIQYVDSLKKIIRSENLSTEKRAQLMKEIIIIRQVSSSEYVPYVLKYINAKQNNPRHSAQQFQLLEGYFKIIQTRNKTVNLSKKILKLKSAPRRLPAPAQRRPPSAGPPSHMNPQGLLQLGRLSALQQQRRRKILSKKVKQLTRPGLELKKLSALGKLSQQIAKQYGLPN